MINLAFASRRAANLICACLVQKRASAGLSATTNNVLVLKNVQEGEKVTARGKSGAPESDCLCNTPIAACCRLAIPRLFEPPIYRPGAAGGIGMYRGIMGSGGGTTMALLMLLQQGQTSPTGLNMDSRGANCQVQTFRLWGLSPRRAGPPNRDGFDVLSALCLDTT